jgi:hypothetical protein
MSDISLVFIYNGTIICEILFGHYFLLKLFVYLLNLKLENKNWGFVNDMTSWS